MRKGASGLSPKTGRGRRRLGVSKRNNPSVTSFAPTAGLLDPNLGSVHRPGFTRRIWPGARVRVVCGNLETALSLATLRRRWRATSSGAARSANGSTLSLSARLSAGALAYRTGRSSRRRFRFRLRSCVNRRRLGALVLDVVDGERVLQATPVGSGGLPPPSGAGPLGQRRTLHLSSSRTRSPPGASSYEPRHRAPRSVAPSGAAAPAERARRPGSRFAGGDGEEEDAGGGRIVPRAKEEEGAS